MTPKYVFATVLGFPLALSYVVPKSKWQSIVLIPAYSILIFLLANQELGFWSRYERHFSSPAESVEAFVASAGHADLPVVVSDAQEFMPLAHYASPDWKRRFVSVVDAPEAVVYIGSDTADIEFPILAAYSSLPVYDFQSFAAAHPSFLLYSSHGGIGGDWWPRKLQRDGYKLRPVAVKPPASHDYLHRVFLVSRPKDTD